MKNPKTPFLLFYLLLSWFLCASLFSLGQAGTASSHAKNEYFVGTAKIKITPGTPIPMSGYGGRNAPFKGVHDDLFARVIVFSDGVNKAVLITTDLIGISNTIWGETTKRIAKETGIKKDYILLSAVHNHSGPIIKVYGEEDSSAAIDAYVLELEDKIVVAVNDAIHHLAPARIGAGKGECKMNVNRRAPDGKGGIALGVNPYGPCDHEVGVIRVDDRSGNPLGLIMNWPCHGVVLGPKNYLITGDWPGAASRYVEEGMGSKEDSSGGQGMMREGLSGRFIAPVIIGASGDINPVYGPHIDFQDNDAYSFGKDAIGEDLGKTSEGVAKSIKTVSSGKIIAVQRIISLPLKKKEDAGFLRPKGKADDSLHVRLSVLKIGDIVLTGVSGEVFNQISVKMRKRSPYPFTFMITHCNGSSGYLVSDDAYPKAGVNDSDNKYIPTGGYEVSSTAAESGAEKAIIENLLAMIRAL